MLDIFTMTGPRAPTPADSAAHPLRVALARGDRLVDRSAPALRHLLGAPKRSLVNDAVVAHVGAMFDNLALQLVMARGAENDADLLEAFAERLIEVEALRGHCQALAFEWRLALQLEEELALDPVLSPALQAMVADGEAIAAPLAMAALTSQARFAQAQRRMELPLGELPAELFHAVLIAAREVSGGEDGASIAQAETRLRARYDEATTRLAVLARLATNGLPGGVSLVIVESAGVALWLSALAARTGEARDRTACATADPMLGRLLLTLRAAGLAPGEAERQALRVQPDAALPGGLGDVGTREAAQWLGELRR